MVNSHLILWSGHESFGRGGLALALSFPAHRALIGWQPAGRTDPVDRYGKITVIVAYAPTEAAEPDINDAFNDQLEAITTNALSHNDRRKCNHKW